MWVPLLVVTAFWLGMGGLDWWMRFHWFQWHRSFVVGTFKPRYMGDWPPLTTRSYGPSRGGDLSALLTVPEAVARYSIDRPAGGDIRTDEFGFPNEPPTTNRHYSVVMVGDSFLLQGRSSSNLPASRLARLLGTSVYTVAHAGRGSSFALTGFIDHPHFRADPPDVLVWCIAERDATGFFFDGMASEVMHRAFHTNYVANVDAGRESSIFWGALKPVQLRRNLPNTSLLAQLGRRGWVWTRYRVFGLLNPDILIANDLRSESFMLFYRENLKALYWPSKIRNVPKIKRAAYYVSRDYFKPRGIHWIVVLIPEKEQVYRSLLPPDPLRTGAEMPPSALPELEAALREEGVGVVNLLSTFAPAAAAGAQLYWPDDTHWNDAGIQLAADAIYEAVASVLYSPR